MTFFLLKQRRLAGFSLAALFILSSAAAGFADLAPSEIEQRWQHVKALQKELSGNAPKGDNEIEYFAPLKEKLHQEAINFATAYTQDPRRWEARLIEMKTDVFPVPASERKAIFDRHEQTLASILAAPDATAETKLNAERTILFQHLDHLDLTATPQEAAALETRLENFVHDHPDDPKVPSLRIRSLDVLAKSEPAKVGPRLDELSASPDPVVAALAQGRLARRALSNTTVDWKFTALDGRSVDLTQMRGQVILVDYWASWCPDCLRALPQVLAAYHKYHDQGFEVVGVSLDNDQDALLGFLKKHNMPWPQSYDGRGWETDFAVKYGVRGIPDMWLIGKDGRVAATGVEADQLDNTLAGLLGK